MRSSFGLSLCQPIAENDLRLRGNTVGTRLMIYNDKKDVTFCSGVYIYIYTAMAFLSQLWKGCDPLKNS